MLRPSFAVVVALALVACDTDPSLRVASTMRQELGSACPPSSLAPVDSAASSSGLALARLGDRRVALLADEDDGALRLVDLDAPARGRTIARLALAEPPGHVLVASDGHVHVTLPRLDAVLEISASRDGTLSPCRARSTPPEPLALAEAHGSLVVISRRGHALSRFPPGGDVPPPIALSRDPEGVVVSGTTAIVAHGTGSIVSFVRLDRGVVARELSFAWRDRVGLAALGGAPIADMPRFAVQARALARSGERAVLPMALAYPGETSAQVTFTRGYGPESVRGVDGYFPHEAAIASFAEDGEDARLQLRAEVIAPSAQRLSTGRATGNLPPCLLPRGIAVHADTTLVTCLGIDRLLVLRGEGDLTQSEQARIELPAGPIAVAVDDGAREAIVWSQFARALTFVRLDDRRPIHVIVPADRAVDPLWAEGRRAFHAPVGFDGRACASCHPDGLHDGLVWSTPHGPMQPPILAGRVAGTAPYGWRGGAATLPAHFSLTLERLGAKPLPADTSSALALFVASPRARRRGPLAPNEERGRALFVSAKVGCDGCHQRGGEASDGLLHDVGTGGSFDTPSLAAVATSAPYMHDGRHKTLREVIVATRGTMGTAGELDERELDDLVSYLQTL